MDQSNSFIDELYSKYCDDGIIDPKEIELPQVDGHRRICELVGFDRIVKEFKNLSNLRLINLSDRKISILYNPNVKYDSSQLCLKNAYSLDLSRNKLESWNVVADILELTPSLQELILSYNPLKPPSDEECKLIISKFKKIKTIVLGSLNYKWQDFMICLDLWPQIQQVSLFENRIENISPFPEDSSTCLQNLKYLSLSTNAIKEWNEILKLSKLTKLEILEMPNCKIDLIRFENEDSFPSLKHLDLTNNQINDWRSIAELNKLSSLKTLLLKRNPLFDTSTHSHNFNFILGRIKSIEKLDREFVTKEIRYDAEKYYLRLIYLNYIDILNDEKMKEQFLLENPCFLQLLDRLGEPVVAKKLTKEELIEKNFIKVKILDEQNPDDQKRLIEKRIPVTMKVSNLKFIIHKLFKIDMNIDFNLILKSKDYKEEMEDRRDVVMYRLDDDSIIHVQRL